MRSGHDGLLLIQKWSVRLFWVLLLLQIAEYAWLAEDAFINFRVVEHLLSGDGLVWNVGERVQVFTSPLWLLLTAAATWLGGGVIQATLLVSVALSLFFFGILAKLCLQNRFLFLVLGVVCACAPSMRDYFTSGLETPLLMTTLAIFAACVVRGALISLRRLCFVAALCVLVRHDTALLVAPFLVQRSLQDLAGGVGRSRLLALARDVFWGSWPFWVWTAFSLAYFGSPVPNTAAAKMVGGFDGPAQAMHYFQYMLHFDPLAYFLILISMLTNIVLRTKEGVPLVLGMVLFTLYLLFVGADYMAGRFFVAPLALSVSLLAHAAASVPAGHWRAWPVWASGGVLLAPVLAFATQVLAEKGASRSATARMPLVHGIADERRHYQGATDLLTLLASGPQHPYVDGAAEMANAPRHPVYLSCNVGLLGYHAPRSAQIVDPLALGDRFLAGMPLRPGPVRVGHFERVVPSQYIESLMLGGNVISDPTLHRYYDDVHLVVRGELFTMDRWVAIWRLNTGGGRDALRVVASGSGGGALRMTPLRLIPGQMPKPCLGSGGGVMVPQRREGHLQLVFLRDAEARASSATGLPH